MNILILLKKLTIPLFMALSFVFYKIFPKIKKDNPVEETIEKVIKKKIRKKIDLTPIDIPNEVVETIEKLEKDI